MDPTLEELQFIGFLKMCSESIKIISSSKKIFFQLTLTLILPLLFVFYIHNKISNSPITTKISSDEIGNIVDEPIASYDKIFDVLLTIGYLKYLVIEVTYFTFIVIFFLFSTSTVVYTVACLFSDNQTTYKAAMSFVPKVWDKLVKTLLCNFAIFIVYNFLAFLTLVTFVSLCSKSDTRIRKMMLSTIYIFYFIGFVYISVIGQLASMVSVLEDCYGVQAIAKSKVLIRGKMGISTTIFFEVGLSLGCIHLLIEKFVVFDESFVVISKVGFGGLFLVFRSLLFLFGLVVQTVLYFVCESSSNTSTLSNHFDVCLGGYVLLDPRDTRFEQV